MERSLMDDSTGKDKDNINQAAVKEGFFLICLFKQVSRKSVIS
jgi:hypothetical protein